MRARPLDSAVLALHQTPARFTPLPLGTSTPALRRILGSLLDRGYRFVGLEEVGPAGPPPGAIALTADDGYSSQFECLGPLLRELGLPWSVFVLAGRLGMDNGWDVPWISRRERHLTADEVKRLAGDGVSVGSHGMTHRKMTGLSDGALSDELGRSREILRRLTGQRVDTIAFPWGAADFRVAAAARRAGYRMGFGLNGKPPGHRFEGAGPVIRRETLYAPDQLFPIFAATGINAPRPLRRLRGGLERLGRNLVGAAVACQARLRA